MAVFVRVPRELILSVISTSVSGLTERDRDEMAIPSYLHGNPLIRWLMWRRYRKIFQAAQLEEWHRVLEFGCGLGLFLPTLCKSCQSVQAIDLFPEFARRLCQIHGISVTFPESVSQIEDHSLDLIIAADVLEHLSYPDAMIQEFVRKLKPNGRIIVSGPTENRIYQIGRFLAGFKDKGDYHHTNIDELSLVIQKNGFQLRKTLGLPFGMAPNLFKIMEFSL